MKKFDFDDKDLAMAGIVILALPIVITAVVTAQPTIAASVFGTAAAALSGLATGRKQANPEPIPKNPETIIADK